MAIFGGLRNSYSNNLTVNGSFAGTSGWQVTGTVTTSNGMVKLAENSKLTQSIAIPKSGEDAEQQAVYGFRVQAISAVPVALPIGKSTGTMVVKVRYSNGVDDSIVLIASRVLSSSYPGKFDIEDVQIISHEYEFEARESEDEYPVSVDFILYGTGESMFGNVDLRMNYGVKIEQLIEPVEPAENLLRNSSFEISDGDSENKPLHWSGTGSITDAYFNYGKNSIMLQSGQTIATELTAMMNHNNSNKLVSWYRTGGAVRIELIDSSGATFHSWDTGDVTLGSWLRQFMWMEHGLCPTPMFGIKLTAISGTAYVDGIKVEDSVEPPDPAQQPSAWQAHPDDATDAVSLSFSGDGSGHNYLLNTSFELLTPEPKGGDPKNPILKPRYWTGGKAIESTSSKDGLRVLSLTGSSSIESAVTGLPGNAVGVISAYVRNGSLTLGVTMNGQAVEFIGGNPSGSAGSSWTRVFAGFKLVKDSSIMVTLSGTCEVECVQLETVGVGAALKPSEWSPNPHDTSEAISEAGGGALKEENGVIEIKHSNGSTIRLEETDNSSEINIRLSDEEGTQYPTGITIMRSRVTGVHDSILLDHEFGNFSITTEGITMTHSSGAKIVLGEKVEIHSPTTVDFFTDGMGGT